MKIQGKFVLEITERVLRKIVGDCKHRGIQDDPLNLENQVRNWMMDVVAEGLNDLEPAPTEGWEIAWSSIPKAELKVNG